MKTLVSSSCVFVLVVIIIDLPKKISICCKDMAGNRKNECEKGDIFYHEKWRNEVIHVPLHIALYHFQSISRKKEAFYIWKLFNLKLLILLLMTCYYSHNDIMACVETRSYCGTSDMWQKYFFFFLTSVAFKYYHISSERMRYLFSGSTWVACSK